MTNLTAIITYYHSKTHEQLKRCIDSLEQFGIKWILVDDFSDCRPSYPHLRTDENLGPYGAFKLGLNQVRTQWVLRMDADDYLSSAPIFDESYDAWCNSFEGKVKISPVDFLNRPYAGLSGIVVKTDILKRVWYTGVRQFGDIIIFHRLLRQFKVTNYLEDCYVYEAMTPGSITGTPWSISKHYLKNALDIIRKEVADGKWY